MKKKIIRKKKTNSLFKPIKLKPVSFVAQPRKPKMKNLIFGYDHPKPARKVKGKLAMNWTHAKRRFPKMNPFGDRDRDGVQNFMDCSPFDKTRQGRSKLWTAEVERRLKGIIPTEEQERARISRKGTPRLKKVIEREIKDSKRILGYVKGERVDSSSWIDRLYGQARDGNLDGKVKRKRGEYYDIHSPKEVREFHKTKLKKLEKRKKDYIKEWGEDDYNRTRSNPNKRKDIIRHFQKVPQDLEHAETLKKIKIRSRMEGDTAGNYQDSTKVITLEGRNTSEISGIDNTLAHEIEHHKQYQEGVGEKLQEKAWKIREKQNWKPLKHSERPIEINVKKRLKARAVKVKESPEILTLMDLNNEVDEPFETDVSKTKDNDMKDLRRELRLSDDSEERKTIRGMIKGKEIEKYQEETEDYEPEESEPEEDDEEENYDDEEEDEDE